MIFRINSNIIQKPYLVTKDKKNLSLFKDWFMLRPVYEIASAGHFFRLLRNDGFTSSLRARLTGRAGRHDEAISNTVEKIASAFKIVVKYFAIKGNISRYTSFVGTRNDFD